jgi:hypothetical protein
MTRRRSLPLITLVVLAAGTCAAGAWAGEPVPHDLPDEPLLELIDRLDLPEVRALVQDAGVAETSQDELLERLAGIGTELAGTSRSIERRRLLDELLRVRGRLIDLTPPGRDRCMLRLEQTETALSLLRSDDALELAVLAGMPTSAQQERARVLAAIALNESTTLTREVEERLYQLGEQLRLNPDEATRLERMRSAALLESDRLVIRRAMAVASRIAVNQLDREERARLADGAIAELSVFLDHPSFGTTAHLLTARMQMATGRSTDAATRYEALANEPDGALGSLDRAEAVLGVALAHLEARRPRRAEVWLDRHTNQPPFRIDGDDTPLLSILVADVRLRIDLARARNAADARGREALQAVAYNRYLQLLEQPERYGLDERAMSRLLLAKLANQRGGTELDGESLPAIPRLAAAVAAVAEPDRRDAALVELRSIAADQAQVSSALIAEGFRLSATALENDRGNGPWAEAAELYLAAADRETDSKLIAADTRRAIQLLAFAHAENGSHRREFETALVRGIETLAEEAIADRWRMQLAGLYADEQRSADAASVYANVAPRSDQYAAACIARAAMRRQALVNAEPDARTRVASDLLAIIRTAREALADRQEDDRTFMLDPAWLDAFEARAHLEMGAAAEAEQLLSAVPDTEDAAIRSAYLTLRARALRELGRPGEAAALIDEMIETDPANASAAATGLMEALLLEYETDTPPGSDAVAEARASQELLPIAQRIHDWALEYDEPHLVDHRTRLAIAHLRSGDHDQAAAMLDALAARRPGDLRIALALADAQFALGDDTAAFQGYSDIIRALEEADDRSGAYWAASLRRLLILERTGRNTEQIIPRIERLRRIDPALGGSVHQVQFAALERRLGA